MVRRALLGILYALVAIHGLGIICSARAAEHVAKARLSFVMQAAFLVGGQARWSYGAAAALTTRIGGADLDRCSNPGQPHRLAARRRERERITGVVQPTVASAYGAPRCLRVNRAMPSMMFLPARLLHDKQAATHAERVGLRLRSPIGNAVENADATQRSHMNTEEYTARRPRARPPS